ncbi:MAG TPA: hypothetical protein VG847_10485 [Chitinophagaceae bacterium]|nr:hypothetical protein [Chitinophagaceae bacterium]
MKKILIAAAITLFAIASFGQQKEKIAIKQVMKMQENAWNSGSIDEFMTGYWQNDSLMFIGKSGISYGWQAALNNYRKRYPDTAAMGKLTFKILQMKSLSSVYYFVVGKWGLKRSMGNIGGYFTLLFRKINGKWLIVADHTS